MIGDLQLVTLIGPLLTPGQRFANAPILLDRHTSAESAHQIADSVEDRLRAALELHEVIAHIEPC